MATSATEKENDETPLLYWKMAREGISLLLNNKQEEAEALFKAYPDDLNMATGYVYAVFVDALMTFEDDKIKICMNSMKDLEKKCANHCQSSWFKVVKSVFGNGCGYSQKELECQIILADSHVFVAMLTFLQHDVSGFIKGSWILRKSYKCYQQAYNTIFDLYKEIVGDEDLPVTSKGTVLEPTTPTSSLDYPESLEEILELASDMERKDAIELTADGARGRTADAYQSIKIVTATLGDVKTSLTDAQQLRSTPSLPTPADTMRESGLIQNGQNLDKDTITRLLSAVSFGYGLLQLGISLLPPTISKLVNFFGFTGNRKTGLAYLMYARKGDDLRAPFATLSLLWYHTIVRPFFALDGTNVQAGVQIAAELLDEVRVEFEHSALFLFFKGRVERLRSEIPKAIDTYQAAISNAAQREIKLMAMHEVGWCYLIELNFVSAETSFLYLKDQSRWSKSFYSYLCLITAGAKGVFQQVQNVVDARNIFQPVIKGTQLDEFLTRRYNICPLQEEPLKQLNAIFWKVLAYELLYLWNTMPSCNSQNINKIIKDCDEAWEVEAEPFMGLSRLIGGSCHCILSNEEAAVRYFREGIEVRKSLGPNTEDTHVSAFTKYELGLILIKDPLTLQEGKKLLEAASAYKGYDFEQRLTVRAHAVLKKL